MPGSFYFLKVYFERETENMKEQAGEGQTEGERKPCRLHAVSAEPETGLDPTNGEIVT